MAIRTPTLGRDDVRALLAGACGVSTVGLGGMGPVSAAFPSGEVLSLDGDVAMDMAVALLTARLKPVTAEDALAVMHEWNAPAYALDAMADAIAEVGATTAPSPSR